MQRIISALSLLLATCGAPASAELLKSDLPAINEYIDQTNFQVANHCSATLISKDYQILLTNAHCIRKYIRVQHVEEVLPNGEIRDEKIETWEVFPTYQFYDNQEFEYETEIIAYNLSTDLAIVKLTCECHWINSLISHEAVVYNGEDLVRGQTTYAVGNPAMQYGTLTVGSITFPNREVDAGYASPILIQIDNGIVGGSSGGALYDEDWQLIGVTSGGFPRTPIGFAVPYYDIYSLLNVVCDMNPEYTDWYACN